MSQPARPPRDLDALLEEWTELSGRARPPDLHVVRGSSGLRLVQAFATASAAVLVLAVVAVALVLRSSPAAMPATPPPPAAARAEAIDHPFRLVFEMPSTTWRSGQAIEGVARLELIEGDTISIGPPLGGPLGFGFVDADGDRQVLPLVTGCRTVELESGEPIALEISKAGDWWSDDPEGDFYREFVAAPEVYLPPGRWDISAGATFHEDSCVGPDRHLRATIRVTVEP